MAVAIVPARLGSERFPGKLLAAETGRPLVQHAVEAAVLLGLDRKSVV
mgnify:CR=1 FL=1